METMNLKKDIKVFYLTADSFPQGVNEAHNRLHKLVPFDKDRNYFGISRPEEGGPIVYRAGTEERAVGEAKKYNCDTLVLKKGTYISTVVNGFNKDPQLIGKAFQELLAYPNIDPQGYCVEWYRNDADTVTCMVRLDE